MKVGITQFLTDRSIRPDVLARAIEERGFASLWLPEHTHIPTSRRTPYKGGEALPEMYMRLLDPFVALSWAAAATTRLHLGTGVCLVAQHDPIVLAKTVASLDLLSGGRFVLGVGLGWNVEEMVDHGVEYRARRAIVREKLLAMNALWTSEIASFEGEHVRLAPSWQWPKPIQRPRPPIFLGGGASSALFSDIVEYWDGWLPLGGAGVKEQLPVLQQLAEKAGRDPASVTVMVTGALADPRKLEYYHSLGIAQTIVSLPSEPADVVLPLLDQYVALLGV